MTLIAYMFEPIVFFSVLGVLTVMFLLTIIIFARQGSGFSKLQDDLRKESTLNNELNNKVKDFAEKLEKVNSELALRNQMYEGLVGQYNELEKDSEKLGLEMEELKKKGLKDKSDKPKEAVNPDRAPQAIQALPKNNALP